MTQARIAAIEAAEANCTLSTLDRIAKAFSVPTSTLLQHPADWPEPSA